jgi:hypothetical protein
MTRPLIQAEIAWQVDLACELLRTDESQDGCQHARMTKKRSRSKGSARTTLASVKREMQKPRLTESVRNEQSRQAWLAEVHSNPT